MYQPRTHLSVFATVVTLAVIAGLVPRGQAADEEKDPYRIFFVTQSEGFKHGSVTRQGNTLSPSEKAMTKLGVDTGLFRITASQDVARDFKKPILDEHDIVLFYTTGKLPIDKETLDYFFSEWLKKKGHGFIGVHSATDTYKDFEPYWDMVGGTFNGHPWGAGDTVTLAIHDTKHPVSKPFGNEYVIQDEIYQYSHWQPKKVRVLMSLNMAKTAKKRPYHVPVAWCKEYGEGRVVYNSLGHREETWANKQFLDSMIGAIKWTMHDVEGSGEPNPDVSAEQEKKAKADAS